MKIKHIVGLGILTLLLVALFPTIASAAYLRWDAVPDPEGAPVIGYLVYYQDLTTEEIYNRNVGNVNRYTLPGELNLENGKQYRFWLIVYNKDGESAPSNTEDWVVPIYNPPVDKLPDMVIRLPPSSSLNVTIIHEDE